MKKISIFLNLFLILIILVGGPACSIIIPTPSPNPSASVSPTPHGSLIPESELKKLDMTSTIRSTTIPPADLFALARGLKHKDGIGPRQPVNTSKPDYPIGHKQTFWYENRETDKHEQMTATLEYKTDQLYMYVQDGTPVDKDKLKEAADKFQSRIMPTDFKYFGKPWVPGIDNDDHITLLHGDFPGGIAGMFGGVDEFPKWVYPFSNEREMFYVNHVTPGYSPGSSEYLSTLSHEFQHMIHANMHPSDQAGWLDEGCSVLAQYLNSYPTGFDSYFLQNTNTQLNAWGEDYAALPHYGASYVAMQYLAEHYGGYEVIKDLISRPEFGEAAISALLSSKGYQEDFNGFFKKFAVANYLNDTSVMDGRYGYQSIRGNAKAAKKFDKYPVNSYEDSVVQYGAKYYELSGKGSVEVAFDGNQVVNVVDNNPHSGRYEWTSLRADQSDPTLTRSFDLTGLSKANLNFSIWYHTEKDFDYAYAEISADDGKTWETLKGKYTTTTNPNGANYGNGYTGKSLVSEQDEKPSWLNESIDISAYAGKKVKIRFEYITDAALNFPGFCVDDISIPELKYNDDVESDTGWEARGFVRSTNILAGAFSLQLIKYGPTIEVEEIPVDSVTQQAKFTIEGLGSKYDKAVLAVASLAPNTMEPAGYRLSVEKK